MSHAVKIYDTCIGCTQCVRACPTDVLEIVPWDGCKAQQIASAPRIEDCVGCKRCESACPTDFLSVRVYLGAETTRSIGLAYSYVSLTSSYTDDVSLLYYSEFTILFFILNLQRFNKKNKNPIMINRSIIRKIREKRSRFSQNILERLRRWTIGFLFGNLNGTFLNFSRSQKIWDGALIFFFFL